MRIRGEMNHVEMSQVRTGVQQTGAGSLLRETSNHRIAAQDEAVQPRLRELRSILKTALPDTQERISWSMPTYWKGRNIIHFAAAKKHIGLYPGGEATTVFADELKGFDVSKGTIRLPWNKELPTELIQIIARWCYGEYSS